MVMFCSLCHYLQGKLMNDPELPRVRAPEFVEGVDWIHTGRPRMSIGDYRGKVLLLDFWTYG
jgi:hypothetical protein